MKYSIGSLMGILLLSGCGSDNHLALEQKIDQQKGYYKNLQKSEKVQFYENNVTKALFTATYLFRQSITIDKTKEEKFVVSMFTDKEEMGGLGEEFSVTLDGTTPKSMLLLDAQSAYLKEIPVVTEWSTYYLVSFPHTEKKSFNLVFTSQKYGQKQMSFAKMAKYVISKKLF